jgi:hypothetical protein
MSKYFILSVLFVCSVIQKSMAQEDLPPIQTDRPDQTESPFITPVKYLQIEVGVAKENTTSKEYTLTMPTVLFKYGVNEKFELRLITDFLPFTSCRGPKYGLAPITIGFKSSLFEESGLWPKTSFLGHITTASIGSEYYSTKYIAPNFRFLMQHTLSQKFALSYNIGSEWDGENAAQTYIYTLSIGLSVTDKLSCFSEVYGYFTKDQDADHRFDCGFTYLLSNNCQADLSGGLRLTDNAPSHFISMGISYRFKTVK